MYRPIHRIGRKIAVYFLGCRLGRVFGPGCLLADPLPESRGFELRGSGGVVMPGTVGGWWGVDGWSVASSLGRRAVIVA